MNNFGILMKYEWKKLLQKKMVWITVGLVVLLQIISNLAFLMQIYTFSISDTAGNPEVVMQENGYERMVREKAEARALDGKKIDDALIQEVMETMQDIEPGEVYRYQEIKTMLHRVLGATADIVGSDEAKFYQAWRDRVDSNLSGSDYLSEGEQNYWKKRLEKIQTPFTYHYAFAWKGMLRMSLTMEILVLMLTAICLSGMYADEHRRKTDQMILCTRNGKNPAYFAKMAVGSTFGAGCALLLYGISFAIQFFLYGADGFSAMLQMKVIHVPFALSIGQAVMILFGMTILAGVLESVFVMFLSELFNNGVSAMAIVVGIMLLSQVVTIPQNWRVLYELWNSMPSILLAEWSFLETRLVPFFGAYLTNFQFSAILYLVLTIIFVAIGKRRYQRFQVGGR